jgi:peptidoglycan/LPS O-acetylase OafA/YrhL
MRHVVSHDPDFAWLVRATPFLGFGHYAVSVFIVISGYCLATPIAARPERAFDLREFAVRRFKRIYPAYGGALIVSAIVFYPWIAPRLVHVPPVGDFVPAVAAHVLLIHNLFPATSEFLNAPMWSVALEAQIYVVFGLLLVPLWRRYGIGVQLAVAVVLGLLPHYALHGALDWTCPWFLGLFAVGVCAAHFARRPGRVPWRPLAIACAVSACIAVPVLHAQPDARGYGPYLATDYVVGLAVALFFVASADGPGVVWLPARAVGFRPFELLGMISYSVYLLHFVVVFSVYDAIKNRNLGGVPAILAYLAVIPCVLALAYVSYRVLERRFMSQRLVAAVEGTG